MKVALLVPEMPPDSIGGGGPVFEALATTLASRGHTVGVVAAATHNAPPDANASRPFALVRVPEFAHPSPAYRTSMPPIPSRAFVDAVHLLRGADVVNAHGYACPLVDALGLFVDPRRVAFTLHGFLYTIPQRGGPVAAAYRAYDALIGKRLFRRAAIVTAVSSAVRSQAAARGRNDCRVIPNGFTPVAPVDLPADLAAEASRAPYVLCIGRIQWLKGFDLAVDALRALRDRGHDLRLLVAGRNADYEEPLRERIRANGLVDAVSLLGQVPSGQIATLLSRATAFLMPSRTEAFPATPLEAMAAGTPAILAGVGGVPDIAVDGTNALVVPPENAAAIAAAVERVVRDGELRATLVAGGRRRATEFGWEKIAREYEGVYAALASGAL